MPNYAAPNASGTALGDLIVCPARVSFPIPVRTSDFCRRPGLGSARALVEQGSVLSWALLVVLGWPAPVLTTSVVAAFVPALGDRLRRRAEPRPLSGFAVLVVYGLICVLVTPLASVVAVLVVGWIFNTDMPPGAPTVPMIFLTAVVVWRGWKRHRRNQRRRAELQVAKVVAGLR